MNWLKGESLTIGQKTIIRRRGVFGRDRLGMDTVFQNTNGNSLGPALYRYLTNLLRLSRQTFGAVAWSFFGEDR